MGMFDKNKTAPKAKAKKNEKRLVAITGSKFDQAMHDAATLDTKIKNDTAKLDAAKSLIKEEAKKEWLKIYKKEGINSGSFNMESDNGNTAMFVPTSKFSKIADEDTYNEYVETYGAENLEEDTTYKFNNDVLERNQDAIEKAIMGAKGISKEDKENLLDVTSTWNWKSECLDKVVMLSKDSGNDIEDVIEDLSPVVYPKLFKANPNK